jgi:hypothetical protein
MSRTQTALLSLTLIALSGCAQLFPPHQSPTGDTTHQDSFIVTAEYAAFYRRAPKPGRKPDLQLAKDTLVTVIRPAFAYSKVRLANGEQGFVANEDLSHGSDPLLADSDTGSESDDSLPPTPEVTLPTADSSPEGEATPPAEPLLPHQ